MKKKFAKHKPKKNIKKLHRKAGKIVENEKSKNMSVAEAAREMQKSYHFVRIGLQRGLLPFGFALKTNSKWSYHISRKKFEEYMGE